ncbi:urease subunit beta [Rhodococcus sp. AD45-ID]|jgi:urease subunit beta|uniref:Urease subunit beta n=2 Tax=Nocardiaceae TaxID=85025 RepID=A0A652YU05_NOCGL|nr:MULTISPECIES: urease subunit beta [Rhodococcus]KJF21030.1 Urease subunit beta [Rhodococcus sp. AD45]NMD60905.1 urease subunit beta [Nocardia globerula]RZL27483.1 MAG: urease subunit beta [Rhodococcus sp. (in: high G+C Gram-positive bacteria)]MDV6265827.1 urease subunit beta [Rhodococcus globerulus]MDV8066856.1 urease subunit beta [Rhodococcus sp. IEGM 1366]
MIPGEVRVSSEPLEFGADAHRITLVVVNDGDRPIQIGSHLHLPAANPALTFDRKAADGFRLDIPSGTSVRFEPGVSRTVTLIELGGLKRVPGLQIGSGDQLPTHAREPKPVLPFGTPGVEVEEPLRASSVNVRISDIAATDGAVATDEAAQSDDTDEVTA